MRKIQEIADKIILQLTELTKVALDTDLSGDELDKLYGIKYNIQKKLFEYEALYYDFTKNKE